MLEQFKNEIRQFDKGNRTKDEFVDYCNLLADKINNLSLPINTEGFIHDDNNKSNT